MRAMRAQVFQMLAQLFQGLKQATLAALLSLWSIMAVANTGQKVRGERKACFWKRRPFLAPHSYTIRNRQCSERNFLVALMVTNQAEAAAGGCSRPLTLRQVSLCGKAAEWLYGGSCSKLVESSQCPLIGYGQKYDNPIGMISVIQDDTQ